MQIVVRRLGHVRLWTVELVSQLSDPLAEMGAGLDFLHHQPRDLVLKSNQRALGARQRQLGLAPDEGGEAVLGG